MKTILITGNLGFIGRHLTEYFGGRGFNVIGCDSRDHEAGDMLVALPRLTATKVDIIIHAAANVGGRTAIDNARLWQARNFELDRAAIQWATMYGVERFVYFSSSAVYPTVLQTKRANAYRLRESDRDLSDQRQGQPDAIYGLCKLVGEHLVHEAHARSNTAFTIFRPFSGYGPGQDDDYPMTAILRRATKHKRGDDFEVWGDSTSKRDWVWIDDICHAVGRSLDVRPEEQPFTVNLATGRATSFHHVAQTALILAGKGSASIVGRTSAPSGVHSRVGDPSKLKETLWADYSPLTVEEGMYRIMEHMK